MAVGAANPNETAPAPSFLLSQSNTVKTHKNKQALLLHQKQGSFNGKVNQFDQTDKENDKLRKQNTFIPLKSSMLSDQAFDWKADAVRGSYEVKDTGEAITEER